LLVPRMHGGVEERSELPLAGDLERLGAQLRCVVDEVVVGDALDLPRRGSAGDRLSRRSLLAGNPGLRNRRLDDRPYRLAGDTVESVRIGELRRLHERRDLAAIDVQVDENRWGGKVPIPDVVVDDLVVPSPLARPDVEG